MSESLSMSRKVNAQRWRVYCTQFASCGWAGYRYASSRSKAIAKACPKCGKDVNA